MYGFSGYATNSYGSERQSAISQIIRLGARVMQDVYGMALVFARRTATLTITSVYGLATAFSRPNSSRTFQDPTQPNTMRLP